MTLTEANETKTKPQTLNIDKIVGDFIQRPLHFSHFKVHHIIENKYRVNVWTKEETKDRFVPKNRIAKSYFIEITPTGEVIDCTIRSVWDIA